MTVLGKILITDDDPERLERLSLCATEECPGFELIRAGTVEAALNAAQLPLAGATIDYHFGDEHAGPKIIAAIRAAERERGEVKAALIALVTGSSCKDEYATCSAEAMAAGANETISLTPFDRAQLDENPWVKVRALFLRIKSSAIGQKLDVLQKGVE